MTDLFPTKIKKTKDILSIEWNDKSSSEITLIKLRDECPCANCKGESVMFESYIPVKSPFKAKGFYEIEKIEQVGNYAIQIIWKDGHSAGIYTWDVLRKIAEDN